jgi:hypothetical protein
VVEAGAPRSNLQPSFLDRSVGLRESRGVEKVRSRAPETSPSQEAVVLVLDNCYVSCPAGPRRGLPAAERAERKDFSENLYLLSGMDVGETRNRLNGAA